MLWAKAKGWEVINQAKGWEVINQAKGWEVINQAEGWEMIKQYTHKNPLNLFHQMYHIFFVLL
jgi:hypothetical protein